MCIAIYKPLGVKLDEEIYRNCFSNNDDGAGFAFVKNGELFTSKGFFSFKDFWDDFKPKEEYAGLIHFRVGSSGGSNGENCHPWRINKELAFVHNGVITIERKNQQWSDTGNYCEQVLKPLTKSYPDWWKQKEFKWMMENAIGSSNKVILLNNKGEHQIFNDKTGEWKYDCWFSNGTYSYMRSTGYQHGRPTTCNMAHSRAWGVDDDDAEIEESTTSPSTVMKEPGTDLASIDVASIDARLDAAEKRRLAGSKK
jgi:hypothetical protein